MPNNLTGQNISDTYTRLVQIENGQLSDGTGSALPLSFDGNDVTITGNLHALAVSSSRITSSVIYTSGSSTFGDQASDTHTFLGSITASGNISSSGTIYSEDINANGTIYGSSLDILRDTNASAEIGRAHVGHMGHSDYAGFSHVDRNSAGGYALLQSSAGETFVNAYTGAPINFRINNGTKGRFTSGGEFELSYGLDVKDGYHITASGNISASGHIQASEIHGQGGGTAQLNVTGQITSSSHISSSGIIYGNSLQIAGNVHVTGSIIGEVDGGTY